MLNFLPSNLFTYRTWEAITYQKVDIFPYGPFYPNTSSKRIEYGDLAHHTDFALKKENVIWQTDKFGYRNNHFEFNPDILLAGDSEMTGSGMSQENTLVSLINNNSDCKAYNIAPCSFVEIDKLLSNEIIEPPKIIVFESIERNLLRLPSVKHTDFSNNWLIHGLRTNKLVSFFSVWLDKFYAQRPFHFIKARILNKTGMSISAQSPVDGSFFFLKGNNIEIVPTEKNINIVYTQIVKYKKYCDARNIKFIFLPVPNKRTIYYNLVRLKNQPDFLLHLIKRLKANNIDVINTFELFNHNKNKKLLYFKDDTHWNENAVRLAYSELEKHFLTY